MTVQIQPGKSVFPVIRVLLLFSQICRSKPNGRISSRVFCKTSTASVLQERSEILLGHKIPSSPGICILHKAHKVLLFYSLLGLRRSVIARILSRPSDTARKMQFFCTVLALYAAFSYYIPDKPFRFLPEGQPT